MKNIVKSKEPLSLTEFKMKSRRGSGEPNALPVPQYGDLDKKTKGDIVQSLLKEQGYVCCYCMGRIGRDKMRIEHWYCQSKFPENQLVYRNLLAACQGNEGGVEEHCDVQKKDSDISYNPADPSVDIESRLSYLKDGTVVASEPRLRDDIDAILNLNYVRLKENRRKTINAVFRDLDGKPGKRGHQQIEKLIRKWESVSGQGRQQQYAGAALYWLRKRLARRD